MVPIILNRLRKYQVGKPEERKLDGNFGEENQDLKKGVVGEEYQVVWNFIHPCIICSRY